MSKNYPIIFPLLIGMVVNAGLVAQAQAATVGLSLTSDKDPSAVVDGERITFTVGLTPSTAITGYTLDIVYDRAELAFESSVQRATFGGPPPPYFLDPALTAGGAGSTGLAASSAGRAAVLQVNNSDPLGALLDLTFTVLNPLTDDLADLTVGLLDPRADDINPPLGDPPFDVAPSVVSANVSVVPIPAALWLLGGGLLGFLGLVRKPAS